MTISPIATGSEPDSEAILVPGVTCWRAAEADRWAPIVDGADYLRLVKSSMLRAERRIILIGWDFDHRVAFEPGGSTMPGPNNLALFLRWLCWRRPELHVYVLKSNLRLLPAFDGVWFGVAPVSLVNRVTSPRMHFAVDGAHPVGAVHHQKMVVVDEDTAFCGGIDLAAGRWDTRSHAADDPVRRFAGESYGPRHEVAAVVDGAAARLLAEQARDRWRTATGEDLPPLRSTVGGRWPLRFTPSLRGVEVGVARTLPQLPGRREVREVEALDLAAIAAARRVIYLENQYLAARGLVDALAARLREPDGPDVVIVLPRTSESRLERESMDSARERMMRILRDADVHGRLGVYWPAVRGGASVYVHSKVLVVDDRLLRIGSSNLNNRSLGFDSECDLALEAPPGRDDVGRHIEEVRDDLVAEHLGVPASEFRSELEERGSFLRTVDALRGTGRSLRKFTAFMLAADAGPFAENDLMDPDHVPPSLVQSAASLAVGVAMWPLTRAAPRLWSAVHASCGSDAEAGEGVSPVEGSGKPTPIKVTAWEGRQ